MNRSLFSGKRLTRRRHGDQYSPRGEELEPRAVPTTVTQLTDAGVGSLRQAILETKAGGLVDFQPSLAGTISLSASNGELALTKDLTIVGPGADQITVTGNNHIRILRVDAGVTATISGLTLTHGHATNNGGGIWNAGTLTVRACAITSNSAAQTSSVDGGGSGIWNAGHLVLLHSAVTDNFTQGVYLDGPAYSVGVGIWNSGVLVVKHSSLSGNQVYIAFVGFVDEYAAGGGLWNSGQATISDSRFQANVLSVRINDPDVSGIGGAIANAGTLRVRNTIFEGNALNGSGVNADEEGGAIMNSGSLTLVNSTFHANTVSAEGGGDTTIGQGGAIANSGNLTIADADFEANRVTADGNYRYTTISQGGAIANSFTAVVSHATLIGNSARSAGLGGTPPTGDGGGLWNSGTMTVADATVSGNQAYNAGGGIANTGTLTIRASTIHSNSPVDANTTLRGAGVFNENGQLDLLNTTIARNVAEIGQGSGLDNLQGQVTITSSTITGNAITGLGPGGGLYSASSGAVTRLRNTIVAANTTPQSGPDVSGPLNSQGYNLIGDGTSGSGFADSDLVGTTARPIDPRLGPLHDHGGPTPTLALLPGSPALAAGDPSDAPDWDQRGPGFPRLVNGTIDIGAFEAQPCTPARRCPAGPPQPAATHPRPLQTDGAAFARAADATLADAAPFGADAWPGPPLRPPLGWHGPNRIVTQPDSAAGTGLTPLVNDRLASTLAPGDLDHERAPALLPAALPRRRAEAQAARDAVFATWPDVLGDVPADAAGPVGLAPSTGLGR